GGVRAARSARHESGPRVALVGYTNAGKSSWMRALTGAPVLIQNALFATLDTTVRPLYPPTTPRVVVADTVGFLRNLPNELLASFQSTLAEALDAQLLVVVVDGSNQLWRAHLETTREVLRRVRAEHIPSIVLVNKGDLIPERERREILEELPDAWCVSVLNAADVVRVRERLVAAFANSLSSAHLFIPFELSGLRAEIWREARVMNERCDELGVHLTVLAEEAQLNRWQQRLGTFMCDREKVGADGLGASHGDTSSLA
ncbi:MAG TPA: GTPase, partial [Polyangiaceae bacterium]|nr:GTPase [Polyangiaceae bacterium]